MCPAPPLAFFNNFISFSIFINKRRLRIFLWKKIEKINLPIFLQKTIVSLLLGMTLLIVEMRTPCWWQMNKLQFVSTGFWSVYFLRSSAIFTKNNCFSRNSHIFFILFRRSSIKRTHFFKRVQCSRFGETFFKCQNFIISYFPEECAFLLICGL